MTISKGDRDQGDTIRTRIDELKEEAVRTGVALAVTNDDQHLRLLNDLKARLEALQFAYAQRKPGYDLMRMV